MPRSRHYHSIDCAAHRHVRIMISQNLKMSLNSPMTTHEQFYSYATGTLAANMLSKSHQFRKLSIPDESVATTLLLKQSVSTKWSLKLQRLEQLQ